MPTSRVLNHKRSLPKWALAAEALVYAMLVVILLVAGRDHPGAPAIFPNSPKHVDRL